MTVSWTYLSIGTKKIQERNNTAGKTSPTVRVYKMLRIAVGGIFEHTLLFDWRYPVTSTYLRMFFVPQWSGIYKDRWKKDSGTTPRESWKFQKTAFSSLSGRKGSCAGQPSHSSRFTSFDRLTPFLCPFTSSMRLCVKGAWSGCHFQFRWQSN